MTDALKLAVVGHTNVGKTSLLRTLTRDVGFGEVSHRPSTTRHVEGARLSVDGEPLLELYDTPGLEDAIALLDYLERGKPLPKSRAKSRGLVEVAIPPDVAAKLAVLEAFAAAGISKSELARRIGKDEKEVRRILDPRHPTKLPALTAALRALGKRLVVGVTEAEAA